MHRAWLVLAWIAVSLAQVPAPSGKAAEPAKDPGVFRLPSAFPTEPEPSTAAPPEAPKPVVLQNTGKPMRVPITCGDEDIIAIGMTCTIEEPCPVYLELVSVYGLDSRIYLAGNLHNGAATIYSILLASTDGGKTFTEPVERIRTGGLDRIQFVDGQTGWVSGGLLTALPRDPFFLLTTDGGQTWRQTAIFGESRNGTVDQFAFQSKTGGTLIIDRGQGAEGGGRYEKYESMTGGESWMVREVNTRPLKLKPATGPGPEWRLQADAKLKAHIVERKVGERWQRVAAFLVQAGECKPSVNPQREPPVEQIPEVETAPVPREAAAGPVIVPRKGPAKPPSLKKKN